MVNVKSNFKNGNENLECQLGCVEKFEDKKHILVCKKIMEVYPHSGNKLNYDDLFGSLQKQQGLKSLNPRPNSLFCTNSWCPTSMQNLESVAQKMAEL